MTGADISGWKTGTVHVEEAEKDAELARWASMLLIKTRDFQSKMYTSFPASCMLYPGANPHLNVLGNVRVIVQPSDSESMTIYRKVLHMWNAYSTYCTYSILPYSEIPFFYIFLLFPCAPFLWPVDPPGHGWYHVLQIDFPDILYRCFLSAGLCCSTFHSTKTKGSSIGFRSGDILGFHSVFWIIVMLENSSPAKLLETGTQSHSIIVQTCIHCAIYECHISLISSHSHSMFFTTEPMHSLSESRTYWTPTDRTHFDFIWPKNDIWAMVFFLDSIWRGWLHETYVLISQ